MHKILEYENIYSGNQTNFVILHSGLMKSADLGDSVSEQFNFQIPKYLQEKIQEWKETRDPNANVQGFISAAVGSYEKWGLNRRGDGFLETELIGDGDKYGYKTYEKYGRVFWRHNKFGNGPFGRVLAADYQPKMGRVVIFATVDLDSAANVAKDAYEAFLKDEIPMTSMGVDPEWDVCTYCGHEARRIRDHCDHVRNMLLRSDLPGDWKYAPPVGMLNFHNRFKDISIVISNAWRGSFILDKIAEDLMHKKTFDMHVDTTKKKAENINPDALQFRRIFKGGVSQMMDYPYVLEDKSVCNAILNTFPFMASRPPVPTDLIDQDWPGVLSAAVHLGAPLSPFEMGDVLQKAIAGSIEFPRALPIFPGLDPMDIMDRISQGLGGKPSHRAIRILIMRSSHPALMRRNLAQFVMHPTGPNVDYSNNIKVAEVYPNGKKPVQPIPWTKLLGYLPMALLMYLAAHEGLGALLKGKDVSDMTKTLLSLGIAVPGAWTATNALQGAYKNTLTGTSYYEPGTYDMPYNWNMEQVNTKQASAITTALLAIGAPLGALTYSNYRIINRYAHGQMPEKIPAAVVGHPLETLAGGALLTVGAKKALSLLHKGPKVAEEENYDGYLIPPISMEVLL